ncbi:hypothetical protein E8L90_25935 [Brevibacillus antibioticus]|uniref:SbsA Ig-like domain-containing protein n=1 Tax=Brevibacillus antibioticus TaxID=2570228 RepID=A0A4U2YEK7_9BACL|nr:hypothetical protein [Brevibacillus antibioticus]TKI58562.1 hypothetical protein E8L90_25935 [Brevibacillus antibioticus]
MNKKVVLSVLSTAVVASMAASAFAAPKAGVYMGGNVKKFYSTDVVLNMTKEARKSFLANVRLAGPKAVVQVDNQGRGAFLQEILDLGRKKAYEDKLLKEDFIDLYDVVTLDGTTSGTEDAKSKVDPAPTGDLKVESVSAINLKQVDVVFNKEVETASATNIANYLENLVPISQGVAKAELQADGKTVRITYSVAKKQQEKLTLTVKNVLDKNGNKVADTAKELFFTDIAFPTIKNVTIFGNKKIVVEFSEPVDPKTVSPAAFKLNNLDLSAFGFTGQNWDDQEPPAKDTVLELNFGVALPAGSHNLTIKGATIKDHAGFFVDEVTKPVSVVNDTTGPVFVNATAVNLNTLDVTFDEAVNRPGKEHISINGTNQRDFPTKIDYKPGTNDRKTIRISRDNLLSKGANLITIAKEQVTDLYGNKSATEFRFTVDGAIDLVKPEVKAITASNDKTIKVVFNEAMGQSVTNTANYTIRDAAGNKVGTIYNVTAQGEAYTYNINLSTALPGGTYVVEVANVMDASGNVINTVSKSFNVVDTTAPEKPTAVLYDYAQKIIKVSFNEPMDRASISNKANYQLKVDGGSYEALPPEATLVAADDNKSVTIDLPNLSKYDALDGANDEIRVAQVKDVAGNFTTGIVDYVQIGASNTLTPKYLRATATNDTTITVEYDKPLSFIEANDFMYNGTNATTGILQNVKVWNKDKNAEIDGAKVILTFPTGTVDSAVANNLITEAQGGIGTKDPLGNKIPSDTYKSLEDKFAPTFTNDKVVAVNATTIEITFSENLATGYSALYKNDFVITNGGSNVGIKSSTATEKVIRLTLDRALDTAQETVLTPKSSNLNVQDIPGNTFVPNAANLGGAVIKLTGVAEQAAVDAVVAAMSGSKDALLSALKANANTLKLTIVETNIDAYKEALVGKTNATDIQNAIKEVNESAAVVAKVVEKINALPAVDKLTLDNKVEVNEAKAAYDKLDAKQQGSITKAIVDKLDAAVAQIKKLEGDAGSADAIKKVVDAVNALPAKADLTLDHKQAVANAEADYKALKPAQQDSIPAGVVRKLDESVKQIKALELEAELAASKNALNEEITAANELHTNAVEGTDPGNYPVGSKDTLKAAIDTAKSVHDKATATKLELDDAKTSLTEAVAAFKAAVVKAP